MTTGAVRSNLFLFYVGAAAIACTRDAQINLSRNFIDATCKDNDGAEQVLPGQVSFNGTLSGVVAMDASYGLVDLLAAWEAGTPVTVKFSTEVTGDTFISGTAYIENVSISANLNDVATYDVTIRGTGAPTIDTVV